MPSLLSKVGIFYLNFAVLFSPSSQDFGFKSEMSSNTNFEHNVQHSFIKQEVSHQPQSISIIQTQVQPGSVVSHQQYHSSYQMQQQSQPIVQSYSTSHGSFHLLETCEIFSVTGACSRMKKEQNDANQPPVCTYQRCDPPYNQRPAERMRCEDFDSQAFRKSLESLRKDPAY